MIVIAETRRAYQNRYLWSYYISL